MTKAIPATQLAKAIRAEMTEEATLEHAWRLVRSAGGAAGIDGQSIDQFAAHEFKELGDIRRRLDRDAYYFSRLRSVSIPKTNGQQRKLGIPILRDRVVLQALRLVIEPACERAMLDCSHAYRARRGAMTALDSIADAMNRGMRYCLETDIRAFFDSIQHKPLLARLYALEPRLKDFRLITDAIGMSAWWWRARKGVAQGSPLSPLLANVALLDFDLRISAGPWRLVRYADDMLLLCRTEKDAQRGMHEIKAQLKAIGLEIHPDKTRIVDSQAAAFEFLGFDFRPDRIAPTAESLGRFRDAVMAWCNPHLQETWSSRIEQINGLIRSFAWYYHRTDSTRLFWTLDQFVVDHLSELERVIGAPPIAWQTQIVKMSHMREVGWVGRKKRKTKGWNGYGR